MEPSDEQAVDTPTEDIRTSSGTETIEEPVASEHGVAAGKPVTEQTENQESIENVSNGENEVQERVDNEETHTSKDESVDKEQSSIEQSAPSLPGTTCDNCELKDIENISFVDQIKLANNETRILKERIEANVKETEALKVSNETERVGLVK